MTESTKDPSTVKTPSCRDVALELPLLALAALEPERERTVRDHVTHCPRCAERLAAYTAVKQAVHAYFSVPLTPSRLLTVEDIERAYEQEQHNAAGRTCPLPPLTMADTLCVPADPMTRAEVDQSFNAPPASPPPPPWLTVEVIERASAQERDERLPLSPWHHAPSNLLSSLRVAHDSATQAERHYSFIVAEALMDAYEHIRRTPTSVPAYRRAHDVVVVYLDQPMSDRQRMRLFFILGLAHTATEHYDLALAALEVVLDLAFHLRDMRAVADCAYLCGAIYDTLRRDDLALAHYDLALEALTQPGAPARATTEEPTDLALITIIRLAHQEASMRHFHPPSVFGTPQSSNFPLSDVIWLMLPRHTVE